MNKIFTTKVQTNNSKIRKIRTKYITCLNIFFIEHRIHTKLLKLQGLVTYPASEEVKQTLEGLDQLVTYVMVGAENKCHKIHSRYYEFSPA